MSSSRSTQGEEKKKIKNNQDERQPNSGKDTSFEPRNNNQNRSRAPQAVNNHCTIHTEIFQQRRGERDAGIDTEVSIPLQEPKSLPDAKDILLIIRHTSKREGKYNSFFSKMDTEISLQVTESQKPLNSYYLDRLPVVRAMDQGETFDNNFQVTVSVSETTHNDANATEPGALETEYDTQVIDYGANATYPNGEVIEHDTNTDRDAEVSNHVTETTDPDAKVIDNCKEVTSKDAEVINCGSEARDPADEDIDNRKEGRNQNSQTVNLNVHGTDHNPEEIDHVIYQNAQSIEQDVENYYRRIARQSLKENGFANEEIRFAETAFTKQHGNNVYKAEDLAMILMNQDDDSSQERRGGSYASVIDNGHSADGIASRCSSD